MSAVTTHVLDAANGRPAAGVVVALERSVDDGWEALAAGTTDSDGRCSTLGPEAEGMPLGTYRLTFATGDWFAAAGRETFYPYVVVTFALTDPARAHHHVPLLLSPFAYTTYRGS